MTLLDDAPLPYAEIAPKGSQNEGSQFQATMRECQDCGLFQSIEPLPDGGAAHCLRCNATLRRGAANGMNRALGCYIAALVLLVMAVQLPFLDLRTVGRFYQANLFTGPAQLNHLGMWEISIVVLITLVAVPFIQLLLVLTVLLGLRTPDPPQSLRYLYGWVETLRPWSMIEVFLLGSFVAYTRLQAIADVTVGPALIALAGVMLCMVAADIALDHEEVWEFFEARGLRVNLPDQPQHPLIGCDCCRLVLHARERSRCPRCGSRLQRRKPFSISRCWALLGAAIALYIPANILPVMTVIRFGQGEPNTLMSGVIELIQAQMWPLALLVFLASITVPLIKLLALLLMLVMTGEGSVTRLRDRTRLYRFVHSIGRWSMIDVFMISILVALVRMGFIATVLPGLGAIAFASVVVLTMFAADSFDPRLMWDAAAAAGHDLEAEDLETHPPHAGASLP
jgi:paraquat-inducible protein A